MTDDAGATPETTKDAGANPATEPPKPPETGDAGADDSQKLQSALKGERDARKAAEKRAREFETRARELEDRDKTETEKLAQRAAESERRATEAEATLLRLEVAAERRFAAEAVPLLSGATREEIEASADRLAAFATSNQKAIPAGFDGGARQTPPEKVAPEQAHNEFLLRALGRQP